MLSPDDIETMKILFRCAFGFDHDHPLRTADFPGSSGKAGGEYWLRWRGAALPVISSPLPWEVLRRWTASTHTGSSPDLDRSLAHVLGLFAEEMARAGFGSPRRVEQHFGGPEFALTALLYRFNVSWPDSVAPGPNNT